MISAVISIICYVLVYCFGSFLLQDMFLSLQVFAFEGQNMTFTVNVLLTCILNCQARLWLKLFACTVDRFLSRVSYLPLSIFLWRRLYFEKAIRLSGEILMFLAAGCIGSYRFLSPLIVPVPQDLYFTLHAQICWLCCVFYMRLFGFRSTI